MKAFNSIIQKLINKNKVIYELGDDYGFGFWNEIYKNEELKDDDYTVKHLYYMFITNTYNENKFKFLDRTFLNMFYNETNKSKIFQIFIRAQKIYHAFARLAYIYKYKKTSLQINHDLYLNPINEKLRNYITILQNGKKYMFTATDLINIINTALSNAPHFFVEPLIAKNPYNNIPFDKSTLYNIYFFLKTTSYKMSILIEKYFLSNFDISMFYYDNEAIIRDIAIKNFVFKSDTKILYPSVMNMIYKYDSKNILKISEEYSKEKLVNIMRPYLHLYYLTKYSFMTNKKENAYNELRYKLKQFIKYNPKFGRKSITQNPFTKKLVIEFDDKHINFYKIKTSNYSTSHLTLNMESEYSVYDEDSDSDSVHEPVYNTNTFMNTSYRIPFGSILQSFDNNLGADILSDVSHNIINSRPTSVFYSLFIDTNTTPDSNEDNNEDVPSDINNQNDNETINDYNNNTAQIMMMTTDTETDTESDIDSDDEIIIEGYESHESE